MKYELPISPNYVSNWGVKEAIREILQNAIDAEKRGYEKQISYNEELHNLYITTKGTTLPISSLVLGCSSKTNEDNMIGKFGEGYKLALVVLLRNGHQVSIANGENYWDVSFEYSDTYKTEVLCIGTLNKCLAQEVPSIAFCITNIDQDLYNEFLQYFPCINEDYGETVESAYGSILLDKRFKGKMYVEGLYIQSDNNFDYGYNFNADVVDLDRDRKAINYYELRRLTAASVVSAETCSPELFKAISDSCVDIKDITDVLDDASEDFLQEYRDMLYASKGLEENTLVATESVMRQLQQMDIDTPVVKGTEIESYLIAKANDKLGLIFEAEEVVNSKSNEEEAWSEIPQTTFFALRCWLEEHQGYLPEDAIDSLEAIIRRCKPSSFSYISKYFPMDFQWTFENYEVLKERCLIENIDLENENQT